MSTITFATSNKGKAAWLERELKAVGLENWSVDSCDLNLVEIQSASLEEISLYKARQAYDALKKPVLVMDGGFYINELNGFPGPFAYYLFNQVSIENLAKIAGTLTDKSCYFKNVATYIESPDHYQQFGDSTGDIFTLTDQIWPQDHPKQWSIIWRILVPSGLGFTQALASMDDEMLDDYMKRRNEKSRISSVLEDAARYFKDRAELTPKEVRYA